MSYWKELTPKEILSSEQAFGESQRFLKTVSSGEIRCELKGFF